MIHSFDSLGSTNDEARRLNYSHGDMIIARRQTSGRGQRGHTWLSDEGKNLTATLVLEPTFLPAREQFLISQVVALGVVDMLRSYGFQPKIKWTNDIYIGDKKIAGILIEHNLAGATLSRTLAGIGLNINQIEFSSELPNPTSMALIAGREFILEQVIVRLHKAVMNRYETLARGERADIRHSYHQLIYRLDEPHQFRLPSGGSIRGIIRSVEPTGELMVEHSDSSIVPYLFGEITFII